MKLAFRIAEKKAQIDFTKRLLLKSYQDPRSDRNSPATKDSERRLREDSKAYRALVMEQTA